MNKRVEIIILKRILVNLQMNFILSSKTLIKNVLINRIVNHLYSGVIHMSWGKEQRLANFHLKIFAIQRLIVLTI